MTQEERQKLGEYILCIANYYGKQITKPVISMMIDDFKNFNLEQIFLGYEKYRKDPKNKFFPLPAQIIEILQPSLSHDAMAREAAARIPQAIKKHGWPDPEGAKNFIGELGWRAVERFGGWNHVCQNLGVTISPDTFYAQCREICKATIELNNAGIDNEPIKLDQKNKTIDLIKSLVDKKQLEGK